MPTYSYKCADGGHTFDIHQSFSDDALTVCPECGGTLRKVFSAAGVVFKGSGFYKTDSKASAPKKASSSGDSARTSASTSSSTSTSTSTSSSSGTSTSSSGSTGASSTD